MPEVPSMEMFQNLLRAVDALEAKVDGTCVPVGDLIEVVRLLEKVRECLRLAMEATKDLPLGGAIGFPNTIALIDVFLEKMGG